MSTEQTFGEKDFQKRKGFGAFMKRIFKHTMRYDGWFYGLILSTLLAASAEAMLPVIWLNFIDKWITPNVEALGKEASSIFEIKGFWLYVGLFLITYTFLVISIAIFIRMAGKLKEFVIYDLRNEMFEKLQYLSYSFYDKSAIGHLSIRVTADVKKVARVISWGFVDLIYGVFMIIVSLSIMFWYSWRLTLIVMG
ncbi:MAG: ABC transporter transmembrane domain-containing protein, partial [Bacteroidota bacterium]